MTFADLAAGDSVFVDANTFLYHFTPDPVLGPACSQLLQRIENQELLGFTSVHLLAEVAHKLMTVQANKLFGWPFAGMANRSRSTSSGLCFSSHYTASLYHCRASSLCPSCQWAMAMTSKW